MVARGSGRVLLVSSVVGLRGVPNYSAYSGSKFWLHGAADAMRAELRGSGVSVGLVCPSSTATEFQEASLRRGPPQKRVRPLTHSADSVARVVVRMGRSRRRMHVCSVEGRFMRWAQVVAPGLMDAILHRVLVRGRDAGSGTPR
jgi:short-subunit dehydrogenase